VARVADVLLESGVRPVVVVTGHDAGSVRAALAGRDLLFVHHAGWEEGMGSSLRAGALALPAGLDGVLVALGDMPGLAPPVIHALIRSLAPAARRSICVPLCAGRRGHPVLFAARHIPELTALSGDVGARELMERHAASLFPVEVGDAGILLDVDTPEELARARREVRPA
jgi:molybdenum cofactor cytidylyltransferase